MKLTFTLGLAASILSLPWWPTLPPVWTCFIACIVFHFGWKKRLWWLAGSALGLTWAVLSATLYQADVIHIISSTEDTTISGSVGSLFSPKAGPQSIIFDVDKINDKPLPFFRSLRVRLYWQSPPFPQQGERWRLTVRLKPPYGRLNEAGFDAERYFVARRIHGKASLKNAERLTHTPSWRQSVLNALTPVLEPLRYGRYLLALSLGERQWLTHEDWQILTHSGLAHLMAISGLHIGLAFALGWQVGWGIRLLLPEWRLTLWWPLYSAMLVALGYAALAGFSLPTQRALIALFVYASAKRMGVQVSPSTLLQITVLAVLMRDPFAGFSLSFWLSFAAVSALCLAHYLLSRRREFPATTYARLIWRGKQLVFIQLVLLIGMLPLQLGFFSGLSAAATPLNLLAVPWVGIFTVPLVFVALVVQFIAGSSVAVFIWQAADWSLAPVIWLADVARQAWLQPPPLSWLWSLLVAGGCWLMVSWRWHRQTLLLLLLVTTSFAWRAPPLPDWQLDVLDVGHGLAVLMTKNGRAVLYDTGNRWQVGGIAQAVITPILEQRGIEQLDGLLLSHGDSDHDGGAAFITERFQPIWQRASEKRRGYLPCQRGARWDWQGLRFHVLWPPRQADRTGNNDSCVVRVSDGRNSVLLTGDIESQGESALLARLENREAVQSDIMLVPHHGSASSSSSPWITAVSPHWVVASTGLFNPWGLPAQAVRERYQQAGITWLDTAKDGQVRFQRRHGRWKMTRWRYDHQGQWYRTLFERRPVNLDDGG